MKMFHIFKSKNSEEEKKEVKNGLLQTYFTSLLCLILCVGMFFGTSYAWFTSEVENTENEIYIGTLDVGLFKLDKNNNAPLDLSDNANKLFDNGIRWEPGYTALETIQVKNEGDLAFKYVLNFTNGKPDEQEADPALMDIAEYFDVWVYHDTNDTIPTVSTYSDITDITAENSGWRNAGSLDQLLAEDAVLNGEMTEVIDTARDTISTTDTYTIALHMSENATDTVMGKTISLSVKLVAYQMTSEEDAFGSQYDQMVSDADELATAVPVQ